MVFRFSFPSGKERHDQGPKSQSPDVDSGVFLIQAYKRTSPYTTGRNKERRTRPVTMNDFIITTKVCFKTLATQTTKRHNPRTPGPKHNPNSPKKAPGRATRVPTEVPIPMESQHSQGRQKRNPTRDPQSPKIHIQNYSWYLFYNKTNFSEIRPLE